MKEARAGEAEEVLGSFEDMELCEEFCCKSNCWGCQGLD